MTDVLTPQDLLARAVAAYEASPKQFASVQHSDPVEDACRRLERKLRTRLNVEVEIDRSAFTSPMDVEVAVSGIRFALDGDELAACLRCRVCSKPAWFAISSLARLGALLTKGAVCYRCRDRVMYR